MSSLRGTREQLDVTGRFAGDLGSLDDFARELTAHNDITSEGDGRRVSRQRFNADEATVEKDLAKLVLALVDLVRQLMERQAARRVNAGSLSDDEVERMGETFLKLDRRMEELTAAFGVERDELNLSLGAIRDLL